MSNKNKTLFNYLLNKKRRNKEQNPHKRGINSVNLAFFVNKQR